ncbi:hypothetical protein J7K18_01785 [bacterium]|nr:hypothetical protein [bacterium]
MLNILFISFFFPPMGGTGILRAAKLVKYFPRFGIRPYVVAVKPNGFPWIDHSFDNDIRDAIVLRTSHPPFFPVGGVGRRPNFFPASDYIFLPDNKLWWMPYLYSAAMDLAAAVSFDAVFVELPTFSSLLAGRRVARKLGIPYFADFRDSWCQNPARPRLPATHRRYNRYLEATALSDVEYVFTVNDSIREELLLHHRHLGGKVATVYGGFDKEEIVKTVRKNDRMSITYLGTVYRQFRSPYPFLLAFSRVVRSNRGFKEKVVLRFVGRYTGALLEWIDELGIADIVDVIDYLPHSEAVRFGMRSDILLFLLDPLTASYGQTSGKLFEYLGMGKPIFAVVPQLSEAADIIRRFNAGFVASPRMIDEIERALLDSFSLWERGELPEKVGGHESFLYPHNVERMAEIIKQRIGG